MFRLYSYSNGYYRLVCYTPHSIEKKEELESSSNSAFAAQSRAKRQVREIIMCNEWDFFATWTISPETCDRFDLLSCQQSIKKLMKKIKRNYIDFKYMYVCEEHKNGAIHFHGVIAGLPQDCFYSNKFGYLSSPLFEGLGFCSFSPIREIGAISNYIIKYISKAPLHFTNCPYYFCSRGLKRAVHEDIDFITDLSKMPRGYITDYIQIFDFCVDELDFRTKFELFYSKGLTKDTINDNLRVPTEVGSFEPEGERLETPLLDCSPLHKTLNICNPVHKKNKGGSKLWKNID